MADVLADEMSAIQELEQGGQQPAQQQPQTQQQSEPQQQVQADPQQSQPQGEDDAVEIEENNKGRFVRHGAFHQERERRKQAEARAAEAEKRYAADMSKAQERLAIIAQAGLRPQVQQQVQQPQIPDVNQDPIGHFQAKTALLERELAEARNWQKSQQHQSEQVDTMQRIGSEVTRLETEFTRSNADYPQAQAHLFETWKAEAAVAGVSPEEAIRARSLEIVQLAARSNRNPAELAYQLAKARGYQMKTAQPQPAQQQTQQQPSVDLDRIAKGQALAKSSSTAPGKAASGVPTIEALLAMDDTEFAEQYGDRGSPKWNKDVERILGLRA